MIKDVCDCKKDTACNIAVSIAQENMMHKYIFQSV